MAAIAADRNLLFGLLALQNGLINQGQLVAAFQAWTLDKARALADHLVGRGDLDADDRSAVEALVARHIKKPGLAGVASDPRPLMWGDSPSRRNCVGKDGARCGRCPFLHPILSNVLSAQEFAHKLADHPAIGLAFELLHHRRHDFAHIGE